MASASATLTDILREGPVRLQGLGQRLCTVGGLDDNNKHNDTAIHIYTYIHIYMICVCVYIYIYIIQLSIII